MVDEALQPAAASGTRDPAGRARGRGHRHRRRWPPAAELDPGRDRRAAVPHPGQAAGGVPDSPQAGAPPPTDRCRPVLIALSAGDRRRQRRARLPPVTCWSATSARTLSTRAARPSQRRRRVSEVRVPGAAGRGRGHRPAEGPRDRRPGRLLATDLTLIATAISEIARNIVKFARARRDHHLRSSTSAGRRGSLIVGAGRRARDRGRAVGALQDGYSTYRGLGLGLPGARRLMDEFDIVSEVGKGTTVTMAKWRAADTDNTIRRQARKRDDVPRHQTVADGPSDRRTTTLLLPGAGRPPAREPHRAAAGVGQPDHRRAPALAR